MADSNGMVKCQTERSVYSMRQRVELGCQRPLSKVRASVIFVRRVEL
jgi:hypothetical protein